MRKPFFSIVIPVFDEELVVDELYRRLTATLEAIGRSYEIIFVDDGSRDTTFSKLVAMQQKDVRLRILKFSRNFGHHIAITAGMDAAGGECVCLMDCDLQDQPEELPKLLAKYDEGYDVVFGVREGKQHNVGKRLGSALFTSVMNSVVAEGGSINTHIFRLMRRNVVDVVSACREHSRFIVGLVSWAGFAQIGVPVKHGKRFAGTTKYPFFKMVKLALSSLTSFSQLPLQLASYSGFLAALLSIAGGAWIIWRKVVYDTAVEGWTSTMVAIFFLGGVQLVCLGILGEYIGRILADGQDRPLYVVAQSVGFDGADTNRH